MCPTKPNRRIGGFASQQSVKEAGRETIATPHAVEYIQFASRRDMGFAVDPGHGAPGVPIGGMHFSQSSSDYFDLGVPLHNAINHANECAGIELGMPRDFGTGDPQALLEVFFVADQDVDIFDDPPDHLDGAILAAGDTPQFLTEVEIEGDDGSLGTGGFHTLDDEFGGGFREGREDTAAMEPAHAAGENPAPIEIAGFQLRRRLVAAVIKDDRRADAEPAVAVNGGEIRAVDAIMLEPLVERLDAHRSHALGDQGSDGVVDHGGDDGALHAEAIRKVGRDVELATADMYGAVLGFAKGNDAGVEPVDQCAQRNEIEGAGRGNR